MKPGVIPLLLMSMAAGMGVARSSAAAQPPVDNERVFASEVRGAQPPSEHDFVWVSLRHPGAALFGHRGEVPGTDGVVVELKEHPVEPLTNASPYPLAFPRPGAKKLLENDRVVVWQYTWHVGEPTRMHFHDKDVLVVFEGNGTLNSTTPDGASTVSTYKFGDIRFNRRDRVHTESLDSGALSAVMTELK
jgi:hypothetical protein